MKSLLSLLFLKAYTSIVAKICQHLISVVLRNPKCYWNPTHSVAEFNFFDIHSPLWNPCWIPVVPEIPRLVEIIASPPVIKPGKGLKSTIFIDDFPMKTFIECGVNILWLHYAWLQHPPRWHHLRMRQQELQHFYSTPQGGHVQRRLTVLSTKRHVDPVGQGTSEDLGKIYHLVI